MRNPKLAHILGVVVGRLLKLKEVIITSPWTVFNNWTSIIVSACMNIIYLVRTQERCYVAWCKTYIYIYLYFDDISGQVIDRVS